MRGKVLVIFPKTVFMRITPAHAGKRYLSGTTWELFGDHPRACGEKFMLPKTEQLPGGSPPHTRGKAQGYQMTRSCFRITLAHAGKSWIDCSLMSWLKDHPRTRGEKRARACFLDRYRGSPPHTRGKVLGTFLRFLGDVDHPRTRGEKESEFFFESILLGSPPHTRGKGHDHRVQPGGAGITPAHAGKSSAHRGKAH